MERAAAAPRALVLTGQTGSGRGSGGHASKARMCLPSRALATACVMSETAKSLLTVRLSRLQSYRVLSMRESHHQFCRNSVWSRGD